MNSSAVCSATLGIDAATNSNAIVQAVQKILKSGKFHINSQFYVLPYIDE